MSITVPLYGFGGGGGAALNFKVVGNPQPTNLKENTIWIDTDVPITGYYFAAKQPENMAEGEVWISTGTKSAVEFNALKKDAVQVYPMSVKQYTGGVLINKNARIFQDNKWFDVIHEMYIVKNGMLQDVALTTDRSDNTITQNDGYVHFESGKNDAGVFTLTDKVDLTNYEKAVITIKKGKSYYRDGKTAVLCIGIIRPTSTDNSSASITNLVAVQQINANENTFSGPFEMNLSDYSGKHYFGFTIVGTQTYSAYLDVTELKLS